MYKHITCSMRYKVLLSNNIGSYVRVKITIFIAIYVWIRKGLWAAWNFTPKICSFCEITVNRKSWKVCLMGKHMSWFLCEEPVDFFGQVNVTTNTWEGSKSPYNHSKSIRDTKFANICMWKNMGNWNVLRAIPCHIVMIISGIGWVFMRLLQGRGDGDGMC